MEIDWKWHFITRTKYDVITGAAIYRRKKLKMGIGFRFD